MCSLVFVLEMKKGTNMGLLLLGWGLCECDTLGDVAF